MLDVLMAMPSELIQDGRKLYRSPILQAIVCFTFGSVVPTLLYFQGQIEPFYNNSVQNSLVAALFANVFGILFARRLNVYPGVKQMAAVIPTFAASFSIAAIAILFSRLHYSIPVIAISFIFSVGLYFSLMLLVTGARQTILYTVPGGRVERLPDLGLEAQQLPGPTLPADGGAILVADLHHEHHPEWVRLLANAALAGVPVFHFKQVYEAATGKVQIEHLSENNFGSLIPNMPFMRFKRAADILLVLVFAPLFAVPMLIVALLIRLNSPGPVLFRQERIGYCGRPFQIAKFRTMRFEAVPSDEVARRTSAMTGLDDPRITKLGMVLRRTRLDELPQMLNILLGHMSWIGPRPEAADLSRWYQQEIPFYEYRHIVRPGITGWAQVNQGHVTSISDIDHKLQYDFYYIKNFSYWLDLLILARTLQVIVTGRGAR